MCNLKQKSEPTTVTQFVHNKLYKFIKKYKTEEIHFKIDIIVLYIVYYNNSIKHNKDFYHLFEKFQFHFKLCNTGGQWLRVGHHLGHHYTFWLEVASK